jgi:hypothetical protein
VSIYNANNLFQTLATIPPVYAAAVYEVTVNEPFISISP